MKKVLQRFLSWVLALVVVSGMVVPTYATEKKEYVLLEVTASEAVLRSRPEQRAPVCTTVYERDVLFCISSTVNRHDHVWYECIFVSNTGVKQRGWIFSERVMKHDHEMESVEGDSELRLTYCRCGRFDASPQGAQQSNSLAIPMDRPIISPEEIAIALGAMKAAGLQLGGAVIGAIPYVLVPLTVGGIGYMAYVHCNTTTAEIVDIKKMTKEYRPDDYEDGMYYYSAVYKDPPETDGVYSTVLILPTNPMDIDDAANYLGKVIRAQGTLQGYIDNMTVRIDSVYTPLEGDARRLCEKLKSNGFYYGTSKCGNECSEFNRNPDNIVSNWLYFEHFHVHYDPLSVDSGRPSHMLGLAKSSSHVFFGIPFSYNHFPMESV